MVSAGNSGYAGCGSVDAPPAIYEEVLTVGAVNRNGDLAGFSSVGPVQVDGSMRIKAEILAPGEEIFFHLTMARLMNLPVVLRWRGRMWPVWQP